MDIQLGRDVPWDKISAEFVHWAPNELISDCDCFHGYDFPWIVVQLSRDVPWDKISAEFVHGRYRSSNERLIC